MKRLLKETVLFFFFNLSKKNFIPFGLKLFFVVVPNLKSYSVKLTSSFGEAVSKLSFVRGHLNRVYFHFAVMLDVLCRYVNLISSSILKKLILFWMSSFWEGKFRRLPRKMFSKPLSRQIFYRR